MFTVTNEASSETTQLGSSCLQLFLGFIAAGLATLDPDPIEKVDEDPERMDTGAAPMHTAKDVLVAADSATDGGADCVNRAKRAGNREPRLSTTSGMCSSAAPTPTELPPPRSAPRSTR